jgi:hypothetical protein
LISQNKAKGGFMPVCKLKISFVFGLGFLLVVAGCGGGPFGPGTTLNLGNPGNPDSGTIYVTVNGSAELGGGMAQPAVYLFSTTADGNVIPPNITGPASVDLFGGIAVDPQGDLYVGADTLSTDPTQVNAILVYAPGARGTATPKRTINGPSTGLGSMNQTASISSLALDKSENLYVASVVSVDGMEIFGISVFSSTANGDAAPTRVIAGSATNMNSAFGTAPIAVDSAGNIYATGPYDPQSNSFQSPSVVIFDSSANGNVPPSSTLGGSNTMITNAGAVTIDSADNIYVANEPVTDIETGLTVPPSILEFSAGSTGNVAPIRIISGSATTIVVIAGLCLDSSGNIYVLNNTNILKFAPGSDGNVAPIATISVPPAGILFAGSIAVH